MPGVVEPQCAVLVRGVEAAEQNLLPVRRREVLRVRLRVLERHHELQCAVRRIAVTSEPLPVRLLARDSTGIYERRGVGGADRFRGAASLRKPALPLRMPDVELANLLGT